MKSLLYGEYNPCYGLATSVINYVSGGAQGNMDDFSSFEQLSGIKPFNSPYDEPAPAFKQVNPAFIDWAAANLIPNPEESLYNYTYQSLYDSIFSPFFHKLVLTQIYLDRVYDKKVLIDRYHKQISEDPNECLSWLSSELGNLNVVDPAGQDPFTGYGQHVFLGFWLRRAMDGSEGSLKKALTTVMMTYDKEWYLKASNTGSSDAFGTAVAISNQTVLVGAPREDGSGTGMNISIAVDALGAENVLGVSMPGPFSSAGSKSDAATLAKNLGIQFISLPITDVFEEYKRALAPAFGDRPADVTEENIQARIRGNYLMALSNKFGSMVLSTGNKSELAVGYCTLYGDMAGGLAVISDVPKLMVYELAAWINRERELIPASTIEKPPSAELRPDQKDEDSLPPYDVLDRILKAYIEDLHSPQEIADHYGFDIKLVRDIALLVDRNEYKRKQSAPGLKITSRAFGFGRPFPIAQKFIP